jgi:hypothetical protein
MMNTRVGVSKLLLVFMCLFLTLGISCNALAADCTKYVSNTGSGMTCSIGSPCAVQYAFDNAVAGDVWCFRGGTYTVPAQTTGGSQAGTYSGYYKPANSGTSGSPIVFQAYPGETPVMDGTATGGVEWETTWGKALGETIFAVNDKQHIVFDGFVLQSDGGTTMARVFFGTQGEYARPGPYGTSNITIQNCTFNGGTTVNTGTDNAEGLRLEEAQYITVKGNTFYNYKETNSYHNMSAIKTYRVNNVTYENNKIYDCVTAIYSKSAGNYTVYRYNWIYDVSYAISVRTDAYYQTNGSIYHNLIVNATKLPLEIWDDETVQSIDNWTIYNNTIYNTSTVSGNCVALQGYNGTSPNPPDGYSFYNNLIQCSGHDNNGMSVFLAYMDSSAAFTTLDYNNYGSSLALRVLTSGGGTNYISLSSLQAATVFNLTSGNHDVHSIAATPAFANGSGNLNLIADFALTAASAGYHAGSDGNDMGADVSLVGPEGYCASHSVTIQEESDYYTSIAAAYTAVETGETILMQTMTFDEDLNLNQNIDITLKGGYNCAFSSNTGYSIIAGKVTIGGLGRVAFDQVIIN